MRTKYVIVGGSAAGMAAAHTIRQKYRQGDISVLSNEKAAPFFRPMIPYIINGKKEAADITLDGSGIFTAEGISVKTSCAAKSVDFGNSIVTADTGERLAFDKILFAEWSGR